MKNLLIIVIIIILSSCKANQDDLRKEVLETEHAFAEMATEKGIAEAFVFFAADNAVLLRNDIIIEGKESIKNLFEGSPEEGVSLVWEPDYIDVSSSGDLAYTYGKYTYSVRDSTGNDVSATGIFHTVWKRQEDGSWKYVWD